MFMLEIKNTDLWIGGDGLWFGWKSLEFGVKNWKTKFDYGVFWGEANNYGGEGMNSMCFGGFLKGDYKKVILRYCFLKRETRGSLSEWL